MPCAYLLIRDQPAYRRDAFEAGLRAAGYEVRMGGAHKPGPSDVLVIWNRYGGNDQHAKRMEAAGGTVLVAENGYLGREWRGEHWYALSIGRHNGAGIWPDGGPERWDSLGVQLKPWRQSGNHILVLLQRGIGVPPVAQPSDWERKLRQELPRATSRPIRWRGHPGEKRSHDTLYDDLQDCWAVVTWSSGAALKALVEGVPVFYGLPQWIGGRAAMAYGNDLEFPYMANREPMFQRLAWAMWNTQEIEHGDPFRLLLRNDQKDAVGAHDAGLCGGVAGAACY